MIIVYESYRYVSDIIQNLIYFKIFGASYLSKMAKMVVHTVVATAFIVFFVMVCLFFQEERKGPGLNRRFGYNIRERAGALSFDPLVTQIEGEGDIKKAPLHNHLTDSTDKNNSTNTTPFNEVIQMYQFLTSGGKFNTTLRLTILFPLLDRDPQDDLISFNELEAWIIQQSMERLNYITQIELESKDKNADSVISFREYLPHLSDADIDNKGMKHGEAGWWQQRFDSADVDRDGLLNFTELRDFLHPEDSTNVEMLKWLLRDRITRMDSDNDGKLNFKEFQDHVYTTYLTYVEFETSGKDTPQPHDKFNELDVNRDNFLSEKELVPILHYLYPGELSYAKYYTKYLINETDDNEDGKLSLGEMLNHEYFFYNTVHSDSLHDDHDEL